MIASILADGLEMVKSHPEIKSERYYYTRNNLFEQSLDIYRPSYPPKASQSHHHASAKPIVALVVGSAWVGHRSFVYSQTSWWNSSGPKTVARLGYTCICIRHRGSFPRVFSPLTFLYVTVMIALITVLLDAILSYHDLSIVHLLGKEKFGVPAALFVAFSTALILMALGGYGSASFVDMQNDVMDALAWFDANKHALFMEQPQHKTEKNNPFIFGGYSSGGHVAATVMQQPEMWQARNLPDPREYCSSALYISPVLSTKPYHVDFERNSSSLSMSKISRVSSSTCKLDSISNRLPCSLSDKNQPPPSWLTNELVRAAFGTDADIPSPIHTYNKSPPIPHIFIGCKNELFGLKWLDLFFCSEDYCELLKSMGVESRYIPVNSDHWNILGSYDLAVVLERELNRIAKKD